MPLLPFSPMGVQDKLDQLYNLPDAALTAQAGEIHEDFRSWIRSSFALNTDQLRYLNQISAEVAGYYGQQCAFCFVHRLPITLNYPNPPGTAGYTKWTSLSDSIQVGSDGDGNSEITGGLTFTISYQQ